MEWNVSMGGRPLEEIELVDRAKRGDVGAYEELVRMHQSLAARTAYVITGQAADAQDAVQEAFVKAYRSLGRFREGAAFRPWLLRIVANQAISRRRAVRRQATLALRAAEGRLQGDAVPSPEGAALEQERHREVVAAVAMLRPEDRLVIAYRYCFGHLRLRKVEPIPIRHAPAGGPAGDRVSVLVRPFGGGDGRSAGVPQGDCEVASVPGPGEVAREARSGGCRPRGG